MSGQKSNSKGATAIAWGRSHHSP